MSSSTYASIAAARAPPHRAAAMPRRPLPHGRAPPAGGTGTGNGPFHPVRARRLPPREGGGRGELRAAPQRPRRGDGHTEQLNGKKPSRTNSFLYVSWIISPPSPPRTRRSLSPWVRQIRAYHICFCAVTWLPIRPDPPAAIPGCSISCLHPSLLRPAPGWQQLHKLAVTPGEKGADRTEQG